MPAARAGVKGLAVHERDAERHDDEQVLVVADPEERAAVDQEIAQRPPAERGHDREAVGADDVHVLARRRDHSGNGAHQDRRRLERDADDGSLHAGAFEEADR